MRLQDIKIQELTNSRPHPPPPPFFVVVFLVGVGGVLILPISFVRRLFELNIHGDRRLQGLSHEVDL